MIRVGSVSAAAAALLLCLVLYGSCGPAAAQTLVVEPLRLPMAAAGPRGLEALLVKPPGPGRHPLVLINHAAPRGAEDLSQLTPQQWLPELEVFARRGFTAVAVMRRGYGDSDGDWAENYGPCSDPDYLGVARASTEDLRAAMAALAQRDDVDPTRMLSVGASAGGYATIALTADPPPGLVAGISFAGARGSPSSDEVCAPDKLVAAFAALGGRSRTPMLWIFAENDHFFGPALAERLRQAFVAAGGKVEFTETPPFGKDGHELFSPQGIPIWVPLVDRFLAEHGLEPLEKPLPDAPLPNLSPPPQLDAKGRDAFRRYLEGPPHKAFAVAPDGSYGWRTGRRTEQDARLGAMNNCGDKDTVDCRVVAVDNGWVDN